MHNVGENELNPCGLVQIASYTTDSTTTFMVYHFCFTGQSFQPKEWMNTWVQPVEAKISPTNMHM